MKITIISHVIPYPPVDGGRIDTWRRIKALFNAGVVLQLIYWSHELPSAVELKEIEKYTHNICVVPYKKTPISIARRIIDLFSYPLEVTSRIIRGQELEIIQEKIKFFNPDLLFLDGIHGGVFAKNVSNTLKIPIVTRSHNIEHLYQKKLFKSASGLRKVKKILSLTNLEKYEEQILRDSALFYDISIDDLEFWQGKGLTNGRYLPPLIDEIEIKPNYDNSNTTEANYEYDIVFLGSLDSDNNIAGITWYLTKVVPLLRKKLKSFTILIAGLNPVNKIKNLCDKTEGVELKINPPSSSKIYSSGRVLINPISAGSGVSIKSIEMLVSRRPIVSRSQGVSGLPEEIKKHFIVTDDAQSFAQAILKCLSSYPLTNNIEPHLLNSFFSYQSINNMVKEWETILSNYKQTCQKVTPNNR